MQELVIRFGNGDFQHGFEKIELSTSVADTQNSQLEGMLPPASAIPALYQTWQDKYRKLVNTPVSKILPTPRSIYTENMTRGSFKKLQATNFSYHECQQECHKSAKDLCKVSARKNER
jgi:hypothetical protein